MLFVAGIISHLTVLNQQQTEATRKREQRTATLNILSRKLARNRGVDRLLTVAVRYISEVFGSMVFALLPDISGRLIVRAGSQGKPILNSKEQSIAQWVFDLGQSAGLGTQTLSDSDAIYIPLLGSRNAIGALRIVPKESDRLSTSEQINLLESFAHQIALALEVDMLQDQAKKSELQMATDRVRSILLQSVSHDLRTPLISIMSASSSITERVNELDGSTIKKLAKEIYHDSEELNRLINNLLQMTYLEGKAIKLQKEFYSLHDTVNLVLKTLSRQLGKKTVHIQFPSDLPLIPYDRVLIEQVFTHLIDNAIKYTSQDTKIEIAAFVKNEKIIIISVSDNGPGLTSEEVNKIFDKFYRGQTPTSGSGMGLGLAICRSIIHAHGGEIWAENRSQGGASFQFSLPTR
jgi:two-component system sensor histidine kinase KdpD